MLQGLVKKLRNIAATKTPSFDHASIADPGLPDWNLESAIRTLRATQRILAMHIASATGR